MKIPLLTFFNNKGGVGKTSLVYHLAWMLSDMDYKVLVCDLDPQVNLTAYFLNDEDLESLWDDNNAGDNHGNTIMQCLRPLMGVGDLLSPEVTVINNNLSLIPGDLALASAEDFLSEEWPKALRSDNLLRPFRVLTAFYSIIQNGAQQVDAHIVLVDVGPNLGAINRSALIATDYIVVPLGADLFSLQGLRNLGPTLNQWREEWSNRQGHWKNPAFPLPGGSMQPIGYVVQQHSVRLDRPVQAYDKWVNRMPSEYAINLLNKAQGPYPSSPANDRENALATLRHFRSLVPMAQEARKPIFRLKAADGAFGGHNSAAIDAGKDFKKLANKIIDKIGLKI